MRLLIPAIVVMLCGDCRQAVADRVVRINYAAAPGQGTVTIDGAYHAELIGDAAPGTAGIDWASISGWGENGWTAIHWWAPSLHGAQAQGGGSGVLAGTDWRGSQACIEFDAGGATVTVSDAAPPACGLGAQHLYDFIAAWFEGDPGADFDGRDGVGVTDLFAYLGEWFRQR